MRAPLRILLSAGEVSGDRLGAGLAEALRRRRPDIELFGMGGERMARAGVEIVQDASAVSVVGFFEVLEHLGEIRAARRRLGDALAERKPDLVVPIDFPDFNFLLARAARRAGVPVVYFVSPQVWAWRRGRVRTLRRLVRRMLVLFPFESAFYESAGVPVTFVGHPVVERAAEFAHRESLRARAGLAADRATIALLPGSRRSEVERLLPLMLASAHELLRRRANLQFLVPLAPGLDRRWVEERLADAPAELRLHAGDFPEILTVCDAGVVASGTASLEAAVAGLPIVVVYRMGALSYLIGRALVRVDHIALPNLVAGRRVVPELVQGQCRPGAIADLIERWIESPSEAARLRGELMAIRERLGEPGVFDRAADAVLAETV